MPFKIIHAWFSFDFDQMICLNSSHIYTSPTTVDATQYVKGTIVWAKLIG